ncbi:MAG TPA: HsdR family type I site-specific deoxyribonuclease [Candidatus Methanoperedens sp.]|nr:HsdR family type I site-specific deoxyribonuclease [Candidatus Methanoperedens sp.]
MPKFTEKSLVEDYILEKLMEKGWRFVPANELERESFSEPLLLNNLVRAIKRLNADKGIGDEELKHVLNELKLKGSGNEGLKQILDYLKFGVPIKFEKERVVKYVRLFDFEEVDNNEFIVSRQVVYHGRDDIRTDIMLHINGIPLVEIECKNPASFSENWFDAYKQIKDYEKTVPELYKYVQIGIAAEQTAMYFPIVPWQEEIKVNQWKEEEKDPIDSAIEMLSKDTLLDIIRNFMFFRVEMGNATKVIARYMQYRAARKIVNRVSANLKGEDEKNKGLIWHWQGSGKTLTMIFAAHKLYHLKSLENPSIFFIVDRIELEEQLYTEFNSLDIVKPEIIGSIHELRKVLKHDEGKGKRGIMITLIHKFRVEELSELQKELEELSIQKETILTRKNVVAFIDEGHRSQYGTMAGQMKKILKVAFFFSLTGTPISKRGKDTYLEFSYPPEEKYLDRYFITDSIHDGFTVKLVYQPRLEKEVHLKKDMLETFLEVEFEELSDDIRDRVEEGVKKRLNAINMFLENPKRIELIAKDIAEHFKENVDGTFKAIVVAASRKSCAYYKEALDKWLPKEYSEVVMTYNERSDIQVIQHRITEAKARYGEKDMDEIRKEVVEKFKEEEYPKILIVTDMLLTGFDAPILQTMYLDKPLKEHRLLQAIARTNRPYKGIKEAGVILDYIGILKEFKRAFELYSEEEIKGALSGMNSLREDFNILLDGLLALFSDIPKDNYDRQTMLRAIEVLTTDEENSKRFLEDYGELRKIFELLGPAEIKVERFSDFKWISGIFTFYMNTVLQSQLGHEMYVQKYFEKTLKYVHRTTELENLRKDLPVISFDENYLMELEEKSKSKEEKAASIVFTLNRLVLVEKHKNPVYESLTDKVERILKLWKDKTRDFERIYAEGIEVFKKIEKLSQRQKELGFSDMEYSLLLNLEKNFGEDSEFIQDVRELSDGLRDHIFNNWAVQQTARKNVERGVRRFVRRYVKRHGLKLNELDSLYQNLMENVENYGKAS